MITGESAIILSLRFSALMRRENSCATVMGVVVLSAIVVLRVRCVAFGPRRILGEKEGSGQGKP
jgi:hypothetical protein